MNKEINSTKEDSTSYRVCISRNENEIIKFLGIIEKNKQKAEYVKQLSNGMLICGGGSDLIIYDKSFQKIKKFEINNNNIYEYENNKNNIKVIICSNDKIFFLKSINGKVSLDSQNKIDNLGAIYLSIKN